MSDALVIAVRTVAEMLDYPSVYIGGPSQRNTRRAEQILAAVAPLIRDDEREAIIASLDSVEPDDGEPYLTMHGIAAAIRARGEMA
jgi:hypothetical protein